jgi:hypothetical protein
VRYESSVFSARNHRSTIIMKRNQLIKHLKKHGAYILREGRRHTILQRGQFKTQLPRHNEIVDELQGKYAKIWISPL